MEIKVPKPKAAKSRGRPSVMAEPEYRAEMCEMVVAHGSKGLSEIQISARLNVPRTTMRSWADKHNDFSSALTRAKELEQDWWETRGQNALENKEFNANLWNKSMSARFKSDYSDKVTVSGDASSPVVHTVTFEYHRAEDPTR